MADSNNARRDGNYVTSILLESSTTPGLTINAKGDQITGRLLVDASGAGTVTSITASTGLTATPNPIIGIGTISLATNIAPIATLGSALQSIRVNAGATALEYYTPAASGLTVGTTTIASGTTTRILYDNAGVLGEYTISGSGTVVAMQTAPTFATSITGSYLTASNILITDGSKNIISADVTTYPSLTELSYVKGVTSAIQTQINAKGSGTVTAIGVTTANGVSGSSSGGATPNLTITLGAITPTTTNGLTITANGTNTLNITAGKTLTVSNSITLAGADSTVMTFPTTSATIARTDAANTFTGIQTFSTPIATASVATMTATVGGGVPTPPNNTTTFLRGDGTFTAPTLSSFPVPISLQSTIFETSGRFGSLASGGTNTFNTSGLTVTTTATANRKAGVFLNNNISATGNEYQGSPMMTSSFQVSVIGTAGTSWIAVGMESVTATSKHFGFKIEYTAGPTATLYADQADGTTENKSSALTTFATNDIIEVCAKMNGTSSVDYWYRKNGAASWTGPTNLTSNIPTGGGVSSGTIMTAYVDNAASATTNTLIFQAFTYQR